MVAGPRINNPVGSAHPTSTSLTRRGQMPHLILGPYTTSTTKSDQLVSVTNAGVLAAHTTKNAPAGSVILNPNDNWGTTTPAHYTSLPDNIDVMICAFGPCTMGMDVSKVIDDAYLGSPVFESDASGLCAIAKLSAPTTIGDAGHQQIGSLLDLEAGNTGTGTGGADGDLAEVFLGWGRHGVVSTA